MTSDLQYFTLAGFTLNPEERATLNISLEAKKEEEKFLHIAFWGKIFGLKQDYFVAYGWREDPFDRKFFYS
jgi:radial spoke head protein 9